MTKKEPVPTVRSRRLAATLRSARLAAGLSAAEAARRADVSDETVYRGEKPGCRLSPNNVKALLQVYAQRGAISAAEIPMFVELAKEAARPGWWQDYRLSERLAMFVALEAEACDEHLWEPSRIPGLLQVPGYARAVIEAGADWLEPARVDDLVRVRMERQKVLVREDPLRVMAVIDESAVRHMIGGPALMREQLAHLRETAAMPNAVVRVLPSDAGAHPGMDGPFAILRYPDQSHPDVLYAETAAGGMAFENAADVERAHRAFSRLSALALAPGRSIDLIRTVESGLSL